MRLELELPTGLHTIELDRGHTGRRLTEILRQEGLPLNTRCGERDLCKACTVEVWDGDDWVQMRGCQLAVNTDLKVRIPQQALLAYKPQIQSDYRINVPYANDPLLGQDGSGVAVDIGTTTVAITVVNLADGSITARAAMFNKQMHLGDDVLTRINLCLTDKSQIEAMRHAIVEETIQALLAETQIDLTTIRGFTLSGNTTMLHLVTGTDPSSLGTAPFTPVFLEHRVIDSTAIGLKPEGVPVHLLPGAAAYVGADITSGVFASGLLYDDGPSMLVDVGTNGEIVLKHGDKVWGCATAAGPAFEGSGLYCGVRAGEGAISHIKIDDPFALTTEIIGPASTKPMGVCGSAYIDFLAQGYGAGLLTASGRFVAGIADDLLTHDEYGKQFVVGVGQGRRNIVVAESDIARLMQAKAAIAAGILVLLNRAGFEPKDVKTLYLAGGFGMHLDLDNAVGCGLFPGFSPSQIQLVGNTSLAGAYLSLIDSSVISELARVGKDMEIVELNLDPDFEDTYIDQLVLGD